MKPLQLGDITVTRLVEAEGPSFFHGFMLPDSTADAMAEQADWLCPRFYDAETSRLIMSIHSYIIRTPRHTILVDTCVGNDKQRPSTPPWHEMQTPWLDDLEAAGMASESIDYVLCTHLHVDHVGWNTRLVNGRGRPTLPNARYLFHKTEFAH